MIIQVTQEDIDKGVTCHGRKCPVSLALQRTTGESWNVGCTVAFPADGKYLRPGIDLPRNAITFIDTFDATESVEPFSFELPYEVSE